MGSLRQQLVSSRIGEIVLGTVLGDGHLASLQSGVRLEIGHSENQKEYVFWKYKELGSLVNTNPHRIVIEDSRYQKTYYQWRFKSKIDPLLLPFHKYFYGHSGKKEIRKNMNLILTSPLTLAVWFMDDGGRRNDSYGMFLNSLSFSKEENNILCECLNQNFSLSPRVHWVQDGYRLYIPSGDVKKFCEIIYPHIIPSMRYKLSYNPVTTSFARLDRARDRGKSKKVKTERKTLL